MEIITDNVQIRKFKYIYFLLKNDKIVYAGQAYSPESRLYKHRAEKDFDEMKIIKFPLLDGDEVDIVESDVIQRYNLVDNGLNKEISHYTKWFYHKDEFKETLAAFYQFVENDGFLYDKIGYRRFDGEFIDYWEDKFNQQIDSGLSAVKWCSQNDINKMTFSSNTKEFRLIYWENKFKDQENSGLHLKQWCITNGIDPKVFIENTKQFWNIDYWEDKFNQQIDSGLSAVKWCSQNDINPKTFRNNTKEFRLIYWENKFKDQENSGLHLKQWCITNGIDPKVFIDNTKQFWNIDWEDKFNQQIDSGLSAVKWCIKAGIAPTTFYENTEEFRKIYKENELRKKMIFWMHEFYKQRTSGLSIRKWSKGRYHYNTFNRNINKFGIGDFY